MTPAISINPGSDALRAGDLAQARSNMEVFIRDALGAAAKQARITEGAREENGRFLFNVALGARSVSVSMPGLPLEQVRYKNTSGQDIWAFPRLFVDGASWVWLYGCRSLQRKLEEQEEPVE